MARQSSRRTRVALATLVIAGLGAVYLLARPHVDYASTAALFNADSSIVSLTLADSVDPNAPTVAPRRMGARWPVLSSRITIDRSAANADPLPFDLWPAISPMGQEVVLALHGTELYVVSRSEWPRSAPRTASELRALAMVVLPPIE